jgi:Bacterial Ig-like domain
MSGTRVGLGRSVALGICLALALLLLGAAEAKAGKYSVAQCGWHVDADANWADSTGGAKFRSDAWCATPPDVDPFDGAHLKSFTRDGAATVSGTRFARWRWVAPPTTGITRVSGTWWHALHDGFEQRIGVGTAGGGFDPFATAGATDVTPRDFVAGFSSPQPALEDRLLCARAESKWCSLDPGSWSAVRALTITLEDDTPPGAALGGDLTAGGWRRGNQGVNFWGGDGGAGVRYGETLLDGGRVAFAEYPCAATLIGSEWRGTRMQPCPTGASGSATVATTNFSDGPHSLGHCATDFAGNVSCVAPRTVSIDNNPPAHPRNLALGGAEGWRRDNDFDLGWSNPDQGRASPIGGASWRIVGPGGFDSGARFVGGHDLTALRDLRLPASGVYTAQIWLRDEAGNEDPGSAVSMPLRLDDLRPTVAFAAPEGEGIPETVSADVADAHSGPAAGEVHIRRLGTDRWVELPSRLKAAEAPGAARLLATMPEHLDPGTYVFRADVADAAGNTASTTLRADGKEMAVRKAPPPPAQRNDSIAPKESSKAQPGAKTRVFARLRWRRRSGPRVTVPFRAAATLSGRLLSAEGAGLAGRRLRVVSRPSRGALARRRVDAVSTGAHGGFRLALPAGPSRRITVSFAGEPGLSGSRRPALALRVRGAVSLHAAPRALRTGELVRLWGRVRSRGAPLPRRGKLVAIQYYETAARRWRPVMVVRSDHSGRFLARYRFRYVTGTAAIRLRAVALAEERWPYAPGVSRPLTVRVSG